MPAVLRKKLLHVFSVLLILIISTTLGRGQVLAQSSIDAVIHYVEGTHIKNLAAGDFSLVEDFQKVDILSAELAKDTPIRLVRLLGIGGIVLLGAAVVFIVVILLMSRKRKERQRELEWNQKVGGIGEAATVEEMPVGGLDRTMDSFEMSPDALGRLTVTASDDPSMPGQRFEITNQRTTLGRKADNDIIFPKDSPVSRHHAMIEEKNGVLFLGEVQDVDEKTGAPKRPTYGTFVNENEVSGQSILLQNGDEIRLGKRVKLKFEVGEKLRLGEEKMFDAFDSSGDTILRREGYK